MSCMVTLRRWFLILVIVGVLLIIAGIVFMVIGGINYEKTRNESREDQKNRHIGAIIDAGGTGTRIVVYYYYPETNTFEQESSNECEEKGITNYQSWEIVDLENNLQTCFTNAKKRLFLSINEEIPLYFGATGGFRVLKVSNITHYDLLFNMINRVLREIPFKVVMNETISGRDETLWGWLATNALPKKQTTETSGTLDFGTRSLQISFVPEAISSASSTANIKVVKLDDKNVNVYSESYLCYGREEMMNRFNAKLIKDSGYKNVTDNPCFFDGFEEEYNSSDIFRKPCVQGDFAAKTLGESIDPPTSPATFKLRGTSNQTECANLINNLIDTQCTGGETCGLNDQFQPPVNGIFYASSTFYYTAEYMGLPSDASVADFKRKTDELCAKTWQQVKEDDKPTAKSHYVPYYCFHSSYSYFLLRKGFKFADNSTNVKFVEKVGGIKVHWPLGLLYEKRDELPNATGTRTSIRIIERSPNMIGLIVIGLIFIVLGVVLLVVAIKAKRLGKRDLVKSSSDEEL